MNYYPVILTGGAGSRLWPVSEEYFLKPLLPIFGEKTLLQDTTNRLDAIQGIGKPVFVCNEKNHFLVAEQVRALGKEPEANLLEPEGRNTAPALTIAALYLLNNDPQATMVAMPADHVIPDAALFTAAVEQGRPLAERGYLVTFGVVADKPETGYGYIHRGAEIYNSGVYAVDRFVEKPDADTALENVNAGEYYWNAGIILLRADRWVHEMEKLPPEILAVCRTALELGSRVSDFMRVGKEAFLSSPSDSIDYAVMEKTDAAAVVPLQTSWSDVGSRSSIWEVSEHDEQGNVYRGGDLVHDSKNSLFVAEGRCIAGVGLDNMTVVETSDAVPVADKNKCQGHGYRQQAEKGRSRGIPFSQPCIPSLERLRAYRSGPTHQVKRLTAKPGAKLSLQIHHHRAEHWVVVSGTARVTRGEDVFMLSENESTYIPLGATHRLENPGTIPLEIIEVQSGSYFGEDDIARFEDVYNRVEQ